MGSRNRAAANLQSVQGLCDYRQGHYASALETLQKAAAQPGDPVRTIQCLAVEAMAEQKLEREETARPTLAKCLQLSQTALPKTGSRKLGMGGRRS